jgi:hypothetical protein
MNQSEFNVLSDKTDPFIKDETKPENCLQSKIVYNKTKSDKVNTGNCKNTKS